jgi:class 3 adenylate cyclase/predicted ATPase
MALSGQLDPEDLRELVRAYQNACAEVIARFEGHIAQYLGDGILAYFGYPVAHEDDARRAARSGLEIVKAVRRVADEWKRRRGVDLRVRVGAHTGLVVVGDVGTTERSERLATGETPNIAARIQGEAEADSVIISYATYRLVRGFFHCESLGTRTLRGVDREMPLFRVVRESDAADRLEAARGVGFTPFVGRTKEIDLLLDRWNRARAGEAQTVLLRGEAGIGKSRHVLELKDRIAADQAIVLEARCSPYYHDSAFHPVIGMIETQLEFTREMPDAEKLARLTERVIWYELSQRDEAVALMASLLSVPLPAAHPPLRMTPQRQRRRTIEMLQELFAAVARSRPAVLVVEDLHWADTSTLELLDELVAVGGSVPLLAVFTFRPDFTPPWEIGGTVSLLALDPLADTASLAMISGVTGGRPLPPSVTQRVVARAQGNPLFVEEVTKAAIESGALVLRGERYELAGAMPEDLIPATVQDSLLARIDRLGSAKPIVQLASALGREFTYDLLHRVSAVPEATLRDGLARLVESELLFREGEYPNVSFTFKHALIQDAAYQSLLRTKRQEIHVTIADALLSWFPETVQSRPELAAHHFTAAGRNIAAISYWKQAGERAAQRSANQEAAAHFAKALELLETLPEGPDRTGTELAIQIAKGPVMMALKGYAHPDVEATYRRARALGQQIGETPQIVPVLFGLWAFYVVRGDLVTARELGEQILRLAAVTGDSGILLEAHLVLGVTLYFLGVLPEAKRQLGAALAQYDPAQHRVHAMIFGQEPGMAAHIYLAKTLCLLGDLAGAHENRREAARIARETDHYHTTAYCLAYDALVLHWAGDVDETDTVTRRTIAVSEEHGFPIWKALGQILEGWVAAQRGDPSRGIALISSGIEGWKATGTNLYTPYWYALLAAAHSARGSHDEARRLIDDAVALEERGEERLVLALLHNMRGEILQAT